MADAPRWRRYLRFWDSNVDADVDEEIRFHMEEETEELVARHVASRRPGRSAATFR